MSRNPIIEWTGMSGKECLKFTFTGKLTRNEADIAILEWRNQFRSTVDKPIHVIWDCRKMEGYEPAAKDHWTDALNEMKDDIDTIWLLAESPVIKMGASIMGLFTSIRIMPVTSESEIVL